MISHEVEAAYPGLPTLCQRALNSVNTTFAGESELEVALAVAAEAERALAAGSSAVNFEAIGKALTAETQLESLGAVLGTFVQHYGGGAGAPFLKFLDVIAKDYDDSVSLGTEYWQSVTSLKALTATTSLPLLRVALLASNLCCPTRAGRGCEIVFQERRVSPPNPETHRQAEPSGAGARPLLGQSASR